jgi:Uma2 family endonuclease
MSTAAIEPKMTVEDLLAMPDDGIDRDLIRGRIRERPMTRRNRRHARTTTNLAAVLKQWKDQLNPPAGEVLTGDAAFCLDRDPASTVEIDVAYVSAELAKHAPDDVFLIEGAPILAVEVLSPSDTHEGVVENLELYLESGVAVVWIVDPDLRNVTVYRPGQIETLFAASQELAGDPELPGFRVRVSDLFLP